jgi:hypothetical protein
LDSLSISQIFSDGSIQATAQVWNRTELLRFAI